MRTKIDKDELIGKLKKNREGHRALFEKALAGFQKEAIKILEENLSRYKRGEKKTLYLHEAIPTDHTKDYDTAIQLISMSSEPSVELDFKDFRQYVMDDWEWKQTWTASTSKYTGEDA